MTNDERLKVARNILDLPPLAGTHGTNVVSLIAAEIDKGQQDSTNKLIAYFQSLADGFAKQKTEIGDRISNEYLTIIDYFQRYMP